MIEIIRDKPALARISEEWNKLAAPFDTPLICHEWFVACSEAFCDNDDDLRVIILLSANGIAGIGPLKIVKRWGIEYLELLGVSILNEPCGLLYDSEHSLARLLETIVSLRRPLLLQRIPRNSNVGNLLKSISKHRGVFVDRSTAPSAYLPIKSTWDEFLNSMSKRRRYDFRRARKRAEESGEVTFRIFCPGEEELEAYLRLAFQVEAAGWKGEGGSALLTNERLGRFFRVYALLACQNQILRLCFLYIDRTAVAMLIGLEYRKRFWVLKIGYDEKWAKCSPGMLLAHETIKYAFNAGLNSYEFLGSDEPWLHVWPVNLHDYYSVGVYPIRLNGMIGLCADFSNFVFKKLKVIVTDGNNRAALAITRSLERISAGV